MKKSELRHIIKQVIKESLREQMNPFSNPPPGAGGGPNWDAAATAWDNWAASGGAPGTAPSPPQPFLDRMATMGCPGKQSRMNVLMNKWMSKFSPAQGQIIAPNNPLWQSQLASKLMWLQSDINQNC